MIIDAIRGGLFQPGALLPRERDLAARLEVSRVVVREAVRVLEQAGIVSVRRGNNGGVFVESRSIPPHLIAALEGETAAGMRSLLETRRALEVNAAVLAARRATADDFLDLQRLVDLLPGLLEYPDDFILVDCQFHIRVAEASRNDLLSEYTTTTINLFADRRAQYPVGRIDLNQGILNQQHSLDAITSGDAERVVASIDDHLGSVEEHFLGERLEFPDGLAPRRQ